MSIELITVLMLLLINTAIGALIWAIADHVFYSDRLLSWFKNCPPMIAWWAQPLVLNLWILWILWVIYKACIRKRIIPQ